MFKFTIRELLLLTLVVAMAVGWWIDRSTLATDRDRHAERERGLELFAKVQRDSMDKMIALWDEEHSTKTGNPANR